MTRYWPLLLVVLALLAAAFLLLQTDDGAGDPYDDLDRSTEAVDETPPELVGLPPSERQAWVERERRRKEREARRAAPEEAPAIQPMDRVVAEGVVLDAESGEPLSGVVVWWEDEAEPCPRLGDLAMAGTGVDDVTGTMMADPNTKTDAVGRFTLRVQSNGPMPERVDLFAYRKDRLLHARCAVQVPAEFEIRLEKGLRLDGRVVDTRNRPVVGAAVRAVPAPETPAEPGHGTPPFIVPKTAEDGTFELAGLIAGDVMVEVDHPAYMPKRDGPHDPGEDPPNLEVVLTPALRASFRLRTDDGRPPEHPTLVWRTTDRPPRGEVLLLRPQSTSSSEEAEGYEESEFFSRPVRIPADATSVLLEVKADGYATWTSEPLRLDPEGGEDTFEIKLTGDLSTGQARIALEDDAGQKISVAGARVEVEVAKLDPGTAASAYVLETREDLRITDLPAGRYRVTIRSAAFAPAVTDIVVTPGQEAEALVRVRPAAKVKIRFSAPEALMVRFRLTQGGRTVVGVPEGAYQRGTDERTGEPILSAGVDGILLSGLAAGTYSIEVTSEEVTAPATLVHLKEGDTEDVEILVQRR